MFRNSADRIPVLLIACLSLLDFTIYLLVDSILLFAPYLVVSVVVKSQVCAWNHHHQHIPTFRYKPFNRVLEFFYALHTGVTTNLWVLHHVLGHHHNYLDQSKDESRWKHKDGSIMGELEYSINVAATAYYRGYKVGKTHPRVQKDFLLYSAITLTLVIGLVVYRPMAALFVFIAPMVLGLLVTAWATYDHHSGLNTDNEFEASNNNTNRWFNLFTGNLGYHTAHHHKQGVHWSKLPELHEKIKEHIPSQLIKTSWI